MRYPDLKAKQSTQNMIDQFGGLNRTDGVGEAEFFDMQNMCGDDFPRIGTRTPRGELPALSAGTVGSVVKDGKLLTLQESAETLKLTVKEAVAATAAPEVPQALDVDPYDPAVEVECADSSVMSWHGTGIYDRIFTMSPYNYNDKTFVGYAYSVEGGENNRYTMHFDGQNISLDIGQRLYASTKSREKLIYFPEQGTIDANGYMHLLLTGTSAAVTGGLLLYPEFTFTLSDNSTFDVLSIHNGYAKVTPIDVGAGEDGKRHVKVSLQEFFDHIANPPISSSDICRIVSVRKRSEQYIDRPSGISIIKTRVIETHCITPVVEVQYSYRYSTQAYREEVEAASAADQQAYAQYIAALYDAVQVRETIPKTVANAMKDTFITAGEAETLHVYTVDGSTIYVDAGHGAIAEDAAIDTRQYGLTLSETDLAAGATTRAPVDLLRSEGERTLVPMGANVVIFPDKITVHTRKKDAFGAYTDCENLEIRSDLRRNDNGNLSVLVVLCNAEYTPVGTFLPGEVGNTATSNPSDGTYWLDTAKTEVKLKVYSSSTNLWTAVDTYLKIYSYEIDDAFEAGDCVQMLDADGSAWKPNGVQFEEDGNGHLLYAAGKEALPSDLQTTYGALERNYVVIKGCLKRGRLLTPAATDDVYISMRRTVPDMDYIVESGNRLWGCRYGKNADGETVNELYACKLGDPKNWYTYEGTALDSYAASVGTDGAFTGAAVYAGNPIFFKENYLHRVYGNYPANFQILTQQVHGVQKGSYKSLCVVNERLFFLSGAGVCVYDGSVPYVISDALGKATGTRGIGGGCGQKYYISVQNADGTRTLYVYDMQVRAWYKEDDLAVRDLLAAGDALLCTTWDGRVLDLSGRFGEAEPAFAWFAESGNIGYALPNKKFVARVQLRLDLRQGAFARVQIAYDGEQAFHDLYTVGNSGVGNICLPVRPRRCDRFRLRLSGAGGAKLISVCKTIQGGSAR